MADRYWVGGGSSENWNATGPTNWSATSGGSNDASVPGSSDIVYFDANSGVGNSIISATTSIGALSFRGYAGTITHNSSVTVTIATNYLVSFLEMSSTMTYTRGSDTTSTFAFTGTDSGVIVITTNGQTLGSISFSRTLGTLRLRDNLTLAGNFTFSRGFLCLNGYNFKCNLVTSGISDQRAITTSGNINTVTTLIGGFGYSIGILGGTDSSGETNQQVAQSFLAKSTQVYGCSLYLTVIGSPSDDITVSLVSELGGTAIQSKTLTAGSISANTYNDFIFDTPATVTPGQTYYFVVERSGARDATNYWRVRSYTTYSAFGGSTFERDNNTWDAGNFYDLMIAIFESVSGEIELTGAGTIWSVPTGLFYGDLTWKSTNNSTTTKTFAGSALSYGTLWNATQGTGALIITGSNSFDVLKIDAGRDTRFAPGTTQTITTIDPGYGVILRTSVSANTHTLSVPSGTVEVNGATITDSIATGGATFRALDSTNGGNNTGWIFIDAPTVVTSSPQTIATYNALGLANITEDAGYTPTRRGFVWSTSSQSDPGNVDPADSGYEIFTDETGTFTEGAFTRSLFSLNRFTTYYYRGFAEHSEGVIGYGNEVAFTTVKNGLDVNNNALSSATPTNQITTAQTPSQPSVSTVSPATETTTASAIINEPTNPVTINGT